MRWEGTAYSRHSGHHRGLDDWFLGRLHPEPDWQILDIGCGTGEFTRRLASLVPEGYVVGIDADASMLDVASAHERPNLSYVRSNAQDVGALFVDQSFDLVISRAVFHWLPLAHWATTYAAVKSVLKPGGWFHAESGADGNARELHRVAVELCHGYGLPTPALTHPDVTTALRLVRATGFLADRDDSVLALGQWRPMTRVEVEGVLFTQILRGVQDELPPPERGRFLKDAADAVTRLRGPDGTFDQPFLRLVVLVQRPG